MLFRMIELRFYGVWEKDHIYLNHKQNCIWSMGKPTEHLALNENWHPKLCRLNKFFTTTYIFYFFFLSDYDFVGREKCSKTQETH